MKKYQSELPDVAFQRPTFSVGSTGTGTVFLRPWVLGEAE